MADSQAGAGELLPLAPLRGARPPAPDWFVSAVETPYETRFVDVEGAKVHYQRWGSVDLPGLLLVHGNGAHAHWYDFIAPLLADQYCVVSMTFGGMGESEHRGSYSIETFSKEQICVCEDAGFFDNGRKPIIVAHSFGGFVTMWTGAHHSDRFKGIVIVDTYITVPGEATKGPPDRTRPNRIYPSFEAALARFRLAPAQPCENTFIVDYIGRHSLKEVTMEDGRTGWTWKFDPFIWTRFDARMDSAEMMSKITAPLSLMRGTDSILVDDKGWAYLKTLRPDAEMHSIDGAQHHVMLDQPLAFVDTLVQQLERWSQ
ncbi:MAG: alpha/beta hydrolase [Pseudomonadota bacterium]